MKRWRDIRDKGMPPEKVAALEAQVADDALTPSEAARALVEEWVKDRMLSTDGYLTPDSHIDNIDLDDLIARLTPVFERAQGVDAEGVEAAREDWETIKALKALRERAEAAERELERWRHGVTVEGDFVCPDSLRAERAEAERDELRFRLAKVQESSRERLADAEADVKRLRAVLLDLASHPALRCWCGLGARSGLHGTQCENARKALAATAPKED